MGQEQNSLKEKVVKTCSVQTCMYCPLKHLLLANVRD